MCRHAAFAGAPQPLSALLLDGPHPLARQACDARELLSGAACGDGWGVGWLHGGDVRLVRSATPAWEAQEQMGFAREVRATVAVAAVRNATVPAPPDPAACAPFACEGVLLSLNGYLGGFAALQAAVRARIAPDLVPPPSAIDTEHLLRWLCTLLRDRPMAEALPALVADALALAAAQRAPAQLNLIAADTAGVWATRAGNLPRSNSLYTAERDGTAFVASEPLWPGDWTPVPAGAVLRLASGRVTACAATAR
ncbi:MAG: gamma-glutamyl hercynylcysteine S-oxide hydrolase [Thermoplasmata archaeon]|jgi:glutamine amidotransferase|nr:gamma-glutamyl hercynylcysteine S-oxide hydrolase [Thermoplasmata archaeon]